MVSKENEVLINEGDSLSFHCDFNSGNSECLQILSPPTDIGYYEQEKSEFIAAVHKGREHRLMSLSKPSRNRLSVTNMLPPPPPIPETREVEVVRTIYLDSVISTAESVVCVLRNSKVESFDLTGILHT